jgi:hypothetical protein
MLHTESTEPAPDVPFPAVADVSPTSTAPLPLPKPQTKEQDRGTGTGLATTIAWLLLVLGFLLGSFPARNSDVWLHLATGRQLVSWQLPFGSEPFASTTEGIIWVNPSWLWDILSYGLFRVAGEAGLLLVKALLVTLLAAVLLRLSRYAVKPMPAALSVGLALLTVATCLPLQPVLVSYLFLSLTVWFLERAWQDAGTDQEARSVPGFKSYLPLLVLFVVWANLDAWFLLGPVVLAIYIVAETIQRHQTAPPARSTPTSQPDAPSLYWVGLVIVPLVLAGAYAWLSLPRRFVVLGIALGVLFCGAYQIMKAEFKIAVLVAVSGCAVCLVNPYQWHVYQLPAALTSDGLGDTLGWDSLLAVPAASPFQAPSIARAWEQRSIAALAYYPLVLASLISFFLNRGQFRWSHLLVWCFLFGLSAYRIQALPFFAIVAGPILALNVQGYLVQQARQASAPVRPTPLRGMVLVVVMFALLVGASWPGWLQGRPYEARGWQVDQDRSMERAARRLDELRTMLSQRDQLGADYRVLNLTPEVGNTLAWYGAAEKGFVDSRGNVFASTTLADYAMVRKALLTQIHDSTAFADPENPWRSVLRQWKVRLLVISENDQVRKGSLLTTLLDDPEWSLLFLEGRTAILGWRDPRDGKLTDLYAGQRVDLDRRAFHPQPSKKAPASGLSRWPRTASWTDLFVGGTPTPSVDREEAAGHLLFFDALRPKWAVRQQAVLDSNFVASLVGRFSGGDAPLAVCAAGCLRLAAVPANRPDQEDITQQSADLANEIQIQMLLQFHVRFDEGPAGPLFLAVRAARRAIQANPEDYQAWQLLGQAYLRLARSTRERLLQKHHPTLARIRHIQAATAFEQALQIKPDYSQAHAGLYRLYSQPQGRFVDLALYHLQKHTVLSRLAGPQPNEADEAFQNRIQQQEKEIVILKKAVEARLDIFNNDSSHTTPLNRINAAMALGLMGKAREVLLNSDYGGFGVTGMMTELEVFQQTGYVREAREFVKPLHLDQIGLGTYKLLQAQIAAALGDYQRFDEEIADFCPDFSQPGWTGKPTSNRRALLVSMLAQLLQEGIAASLQPQSAFSTIGLVLHGFPSKIVIVHKMRTLLHEIHDEADWATLRGVLALESGETERAKVLLGEALQLWESAAKAKSDYGMDFPARPLAQYYLGWIETTAGQALQRK